MAAPATAAELLERLGVDPAGADADGDELQHNRWLSPGVWRIRTGNGQRAVLKYAQVGRARGETAWDAHWTAGDLDPHRWTYWRREPLAYQSGLPAAYAGSGIVAPACLALDVGDTDAALLLEWIDDDEAWAHPVVRENFPPGLREAVQLVHASRERLYQISESLPRTLCHLDFWPKNLIRRADGQIALLDWAFAGVGASGEDPGNLVPDSVFDHFIPAAEMPDLEQAVFEGYLAGLREAGWDDDPRLVRLGMWSSAVKYDWLAAFTLSQAPVQRQYRYGGGGEIDAGFKFRERSRALLFNAGWARQALDLADDLGL
jgi:Phosphotransferase enzyme family